MASIRPIWPNLSAFYFVTFGSCLAEDLSRLSGCSKAWQKNVGLSIKVAESVSGNIQNVPGCDPMQPAPVNLLKQRDETRSSLEVASNSECDAVIWLVMFPVQNGHGSADFTSPPIQGLVHLSQRSVLYDSLGHLN